MHTNYRNAVVVAAVLLLPAGLRAGGNEDIAFFETKIRPVLVEHCYSCHSVNLKKPKGKLLLDSRDGVRKGGESGPAIVPGDPAKSLLIRAIRHTDKELKMPPENKLPAAVIADFETWVKRGAPDPRDKGLVLLAPTPWDEVFKQRRQLWSLQPVRKPALPAVRNEAWSSQAIDRFILAGLEGTGLSAGAPADARTLLRRLSLVLTGLPPPADEVEEFVKAHAGAANPQAAQAVVTRAVDRLLASPHFGERWARHWLDVVRYAETHGNEWNYEVHHAWRYRDYLIRAFNDDVPYDRLAMEHIAGDLLPPRWNAKEQSDESLIGTAFWRFGEVNHDDCVEFRQIGYDLFDNQIDTFGKTFLATTIACARCHDHKLDAISMKDYYAMLGILRSSRQVSHTIDAPEVNAKPRERLRELNAQMRTELGRIWRDEAKTVGKYLLAAQAAIDGRDNAKKLADALDKERLSQWRKALETKADIDDLAYPWRTMSGRPGGEAFATAWHTLADQIAGEGRERTEFNAKQFTAFGDFRHAGDIGTWEKSGQGTAAGPTAAGTVAIHAEGDGPLATVLPAGLYTHALSQRLNGTLRSPQLPAGKKYISFRVLGDKTAAVRLVSNNCQLNYANYKALTKNEWTWLKFRIPDDAGILQTYAELLTKFDNPKFPDQLGTLGADTYNARVPWQQAARDPESFFGITRVVVHDCEDTPRSDLRHLQRLFQDAHGKEPQDYEQLAQRYVLATGAVLRAWEQGNASDDDVRWIDWLLKRDLLGNHRKASAKLDMLAAQYREAEKELTLPRIVPGMADAPSGYDQPLLARGDFNKPGTAVARRFLEVLETPGPTFAAKGSGRLELAQRIASANNPLTARVMVNRVWHHLFGAGLVRTVDDFGHLGDRPSHPELLDHLAAEFVADGWSIKQLIRRLVLTRTFQMTARANPQATAVDPDNRLLHHYPARRLEAEAIRDAILAASGRLDRTQFGYSIDPWREKTNADRRLFPGPLDGNGRRSIYIKVNLMEPPKFLGAFDFPGGKVTRGRRDVTNVPAQALALLNDPFVVQQAEFWAERQVKQADATVGARIEQMFAMALGRPPLADERERFERAVAELAVVHETAPAAVLSNRDIWRDVGHAFFNMKEFIYIP